MHSGDPQPTPQRSAKTHRSLSSASPDNSRNSWVSTVCRRGGLRGAGAGTEAAGGRWGAGGARWAVTEHRPPRGDAGPPGLPTAEAGDRGVGRSCEGEQRHGEGRGRVARTMRLYSGCHRAGSCSDREGKAEGWGRGGGVGPAAKSLCTGDRPAAAPSLPKGDAPGAAVLYHLLRCKRCHEQRRETRSGRRACVQPWRGGPVSPRDAPPAGGADAERHVCIPAQPQCWPQPAAWDRVGFPQQV